jgi:hypothetical protein
MPENQWQRRAVFQRALAESALETARARLREAEVAEETRAKRTEIEQKIADATTLFERATQDADQHESAVADFEEQIRQTKRRIATERAREERLSRRLAHREEYQAAADALSAAEEKLAAANRAVDEAAAHRDPNTRGTMTEIRSIASSARLKPSIRNLDAALLNVRDKADGWLAATSKDAKNNLAHALSARAVAEQERSALAEQASKLAGLDADVFEHEATATALEEEETALGLLEMRHTLVSEQHEDACAERAAAEITIQALVAEQEALPPAPKRTLEEARALVSVTETSVTTARDREEAARSAHEEAQKAAQWAHAERMGEGAPEPTQDALEALARQKLTLTRTLDRNEGIASSLEAAVRALEADRAALVLAERDEGDLAELLRVLSPKGMQAYEADVVGTEVADYATRLLQKHGFRWTLTYEPLRDDVEQARWKLTDLDTGLSFDARSKGGAASEGQSFVTMTAIFFGARYCVATRGGAVPDSTITIDEMTGAVREPRVQPWLALVRDGAEQTGARVVLFVPPNDSRLVNACDGRILVEPTGPGSSVVRT